MDDALEVVNLVKPARGFSTDLTLFSLMVSETYYAFFGNREGHAEGRELVRLSCLAEALEMAIHLNYVMGRTKLALFYILQ